MVRSSKTPSKEKLGKPLKSLFIFGISGHVGERLASMTEASGEFELVTGSALRGKFAENADLSKGGLNERGVAALARCSHVVSTVAPLAKVGADPILRTCGPLLSELAQNGTMVWFGYLSTTAVYGDHQGRMVDEDRDVGPSMDRGIWRFQSEQGWRATGCPLHVFRLPGIYGPGTGPLAKAPSAKQLIVKHDHVFCRVHVDDICRALLLSMHKPNPGRVYNVCDDEPAPSHIVSLYACKLLGIPAPPQVDFAHADVSDMVKSFYSESRRISNDRLKRELGFVPMYPSFREGMQAQMEEQEKQQQEKQALTDLKPSPTSELLAQSQTSVALTGASPAAPPPQYKSWMTWLLLKLKHFLRYVWWILWKRQRTVAVLVDNGSLRPGATLGMRRLARLVQVQTGVRTVPISARFADRISSDLLDGQPAQVLCKSALELAAGRQAVLRIIPLFLGPSDVVVKDLPALVETPAKTIASPMVDLQEQAASCLVTECLARAVLALRMTQPVRVVLVDHGSPNPNICRIRRALAARLR